MKKIASYIVLGVLFVATVNAQYFDFSRLNLEWLTEDSLNVIHADSNLIKFFDKLQKLEKGKLNQINIVHVGDSHIQADWYSGTMRKNLQTQFGNAGRGLIFPHKVARTNAPADVYSFSNTQWDAFRNLHNQDKYPVGLSGHVIATEDSNAILKISLNDKHEMGYSFNKLTFIHPMGSEYYEFMLSSSNERDVLEKNTTYQEDVTYKVKSGDYLGKIAAKFNTSVSNIKALNGLRNDNIYPGQVLKIKKTTVSKPVKLPADTFHDFQLICCTDSSCTVVELDTLIDFAFMRSMKGYQNQKLMQWDGIVLENTNQKGILYHTIGVNGAMYSHFNKTPRFFEQLPVLKPDLIIVSLGTNEALNARTDKLFDDDLVMFFANIRKKVGNVPVIITTPPDNRKHPHNAKLLSERLVEFANLNDMAVFNLYEVLGGGGSFTKMQQRGFAQSDKVHFTAKGYTAMGELMFDALMKSYQKSLENGLE